MSSKTNKAILAAVTAVLFTVFVFLMLWGFGKWNPTGMETGTPTGLAQKCVCCGGIAVLLGSTLFLTIKEVLRTKNEPPTERPVWYYPLFAGLLSLAVMCVAYSFLGMWPFGNKSAMMVDMHHQYAPLLSELRHDILNGGDPLYTFEVGLGANYLSLFGYYLASPFNAFLLLFPERFLAEGILFITLLKNALTGAFFAFCVQELHGKRGLHVPAVAVMYSMMMYLIAYSWNLMWLDVIMILPLVVYGLERLLRTGKYLTYVLTLAYALYANYYIGFMLCIFLVFYYVTYCFRSPRDGHTIGISFARFAGFSVLAAGLVAVLLIPVYFALQNTSAAGADLPDITNTLDIFQMLGRHLVDTSPTVRAGNLPNIYCGVLTALCVPLFLTNKGITPRRRAAFAGLWLVLLFSFLVNWTDLAWHGLHAPNDLPYRFSFVYSFLLLLMAHQVLVNLRGITVKHVLCTFAGAVTYLMLEEHFGGEAYGFSTVYINLAVVAVYTVILTLAVKKKMRKRVAYAVLLIAVVAEMALGGGNSMVKLNANEYFTNHADYVDNENTAAIRAAVAKTQHIGNAATDGDFYRLEFLPRRTCVDTALFHYRGITSFSSSNYYDTTRMMGGLGYAINGVNSHLYKSYQPFTDSLLGIRYVILAENEPAPAPLRYVDEMTVGNTTYKIYENPGALGLGYVVSSDIHDYTYAEYDPFYSQNNLFTALTGDYTSLFTTYGVTTADPSMGSAGSTTSGFHTYTDEENQMATFTVTVENTAPVFLFADCRAADGLSIDCNGQNWSVTPYEPYIINAGTLEAGTTVTLTVTSDVACGGNFYVAELNAAALQTNVDALRESQLTVTDDSDSRLVGKIAATRDGVLMTSIPYDEGWTVTVDGKKVETFAAADGLVAFDITAGDHTVTFTYTPKGLLVGGVVSVLSLIVLIALLIVGKRRRSAEAVKDSLDFEHVQPIQKGFAVTDATVAELPPLPETLAELTDQSPPSE